MEQHAHRLKFKIFGEFSKVILASLVCLAVCLIAFAVRVNAADENISLANRNDVVMSIRGALKARARNVSVNFRTDKDVLDSIQSYVDELMEEALSETDDPAEGDYIRFQQGGYRTHITRYADSAGYIYNVTVTPDYYTYRVWEDEVDEWVRDTVSGFHFTKESTDRYKIRVIYDFIKNNFNYDEVHEKKENNHLKTTAYAAMRYHTVVCQGFAVLAYRLLRESGIDTRIITGYAYSAGDSGTDAYHERNIADVGEYHAWNIVKVDGLYYNLDITWDKVRGDESCYMKGMSEFPGHLPDEKYREDEFISRYKMAV